MSFPYIPPTSTFPTSLYFFPLFLSALVCSLCSLRISGCSLYFSLCSTVTCTICFLVIYKSIKLVWCCAALFLPTSLNLFTSSIQSFSSPFISQSIKSPNTCFIFLKICNCHFFSSPNLCLCFPRLVFSSLSLSPLHCTLICLLFLLHLVIFYCLSFYPHPYSSLYLFIPTFLLFPLVLHLSISMSALLSCFPSVLFSCLFIFLPPYPSFDGPCRLRRDRETF